MTTVGPTLGLAPYNPINQVTPFTYRDNATYLTILKGLCDYVVNLALQVNDGFAQSDANLQAAITELTTYIDSEIARLESIIDTADGDAIIFDPTEGQTKKGAGVALSRTYDNLRLYAYFANEYDGLALTAKQYDDLQYKARHYDLSVTYPDLHAVQNE